MKLDNIVLICIICLVLYVLYFILIKSKEGMDNQTTTYKDYDLNDPSNALILAEQNAGNISYLKSRIDDVMNLKSTIDTMQQNITALQTQVDGLVQQQASFAQEMAGSDPVTITGTT